MPKRFTKQSYFLDNKYVAKNWGKWGVLNINKNGELIVSNWSKALKEAVSNSAELKDPIYFLSVPSASGLFVPVSIGYKNKWLKILCIVDTGAYYSGFNREVAEELGIDFKKYKKEKNFGVGGEVDSIIVKNIKLHLPEEKQSINLTASFTGQKEMPSLLGCVGFLDFYEVVFNPKFGMKFRYIGQKAK